MDERFILIVKSKMMSFKSFLRTWVQLYYNMCKYLSGFEDLFPDSVSVLYLAWAYHTVFDNLIAQYHYHISAKEVLMVLSLYMAPSCVTESVRKE